MNIKCFDECKNNIYMRFKEHNIDPDAPKVSNSDYTPMTQDPQVWVTIDRDNVLCFDGKPVGYENFALYPYLLYENKELPVTSRLFHQWADTDCKGCKKINTCSSLTTKTHRLRTIDIFHAAFENIRKNTIIFNIESFDDPKNVEYYSLYDLCGSLNNKPDSNDYIDMNGIELDTTKTYVITNSMIKHGGVGEIILRDCILKSGFANGYYIFPASDHEFLIHSVDDIDPDWLNDTLSKFNREIPKDLNFLQPYQVDSTGHSEVYMTAQWFINNLLKTPFVAI